MGFEQMAGFDKRFALRALSIGCCLIENILTLSQVQAFIHKILFSCDHESIKDSVVSEGKKAASPCIIYLHGCI